MKDWLLDILREPDTQASLKYNEQEHTLLSSGNSFKVEDGIPSFVSEKPSKAGFDYTSHYAIDAEQFDYFRERTDLLTATHLRLLRDTVMKQVPAGSRLLLDVGCGCAFVAERFCPKGINVVSMDIARANTQKALSKYHFPTHAAVVADAYHLPFADQTFDCIVASEIIEHTVDPQGFVASLLSKLKPGGTLVVSTPYKEKIAYSLCIHCNCKTPHNAHLHSFDKDKMRHIVEPLPAEIAGMYLVGNKLLLRSHLAMPLSHLGIPFWRLCDRLLNRLVPKAEHFVITIRKR